MSDTFTIFGNPISEKIMKKAAKSQNKYIKKFGDDRDTNYHLKTTDTPVIGDRFGVKNLVLSKEALTPLDSQPVIIGNIRMGFGHYRISMAMASCAHALGYTPYWLDLCSMQDATCGKVISYQNDLYSLGSRLSQNFSLFNKLIWEPMNSEGFRKLSYNAVDQKNSELMSPVLHDLPKDIPYIATHVWPAQAAVHAGLTHVVNAIPDNWPMALHLAEGSIHTVQTPSAYLGYKALRGMQKGTTLSPMPEASLYQTGHYIDHELVSNLDADCEERLTRLQREMPKRYLLTIGGAGAQKELFEEIIKTLLPEIKANKATLFINMGDHLKVWNELKKEIPDMNALIEEHFDHFEEAAVWIDTQKQENICGIHAFYHKDIFAAVYSTNLLMRISDIMITKPSELSYYPIPKLMIKRVGGHEFWGAVRAAEVGDGTYECDTVEDVKSMLMLLQNDPETFIHMIHCIQKANQIGLYNGAYEVVRLAVK